jgi:galactonate dehydratase
VGIGIDFHGPRSQGMAKVLVKEMEAFRPLFIEEPVLPENNEALLEISATLPFRLRLASECISRWAFKSVLASGCVDIIQRM